jgi:hypothetical protein
LKEITKTLKPPRALFVPFDLGYPLGEAHNPELQHKVIKSTLGLLSRNDTPVLENF